MGSLFNYESMHIDPSDPDTLIFNLPTLLQRVGDFAAGYNQLDHIAVNMKIQQLKMIDTDGETLASYNFSIVV